MEFKSIKDFAGQSLEKNELSSLHGGYCCSSGAGSSSEAGISWSADTTYHNDETGDVIKSVKHTTTDASTCDDSGIKVTSD